MPPIKLNIRLVVSFGFVFLIYITYLRINWSAVYRYFMIKVSIHFSSQTPAAPIP